MGINDFFSSSSNLKGFHLKKKKTMKVFYLYIYEGLLSSFTKVFSGNTF